MISNIYFFVCAVVGTFDIVFPIFEFFYSRNTFNYKAVIMFTLGLIMITVSIIR